jgi:hypothetical protein
MTAQVEVPGQAVGDVDLRFLVGPGRQLGRRELRGRPGPDHEFHFASRVGPDGSADLRGWVAPAGLFTAHGDLRLGWPSGGRRPVVSPYQQRGLTQHSSARAP